jgi:GNAT superfamily N-acetyltransferase
MIDSRLAVIPDAEKISELYGGWNEFRKILPNNMLAQESPSDIARKISSGEKIYLVAIYKKKIIGSCYLDMQFSSLNCIRLGNMFVAKKFRSRGAGLKLVNKAIDYARSVGIKKVWFWTQHELKDAIRLYEKCGFVLEGIQKKQFCDKDALVYGKVI